MAASDIAKIVARVNWIIGSRGASFDTTVSDDRFILEEIQRAVVETEGEIVRAICEGHHPMRTSFLNWSSSLANGDTLPVHIGQVEAVRIEPYSGAGTYIPGESTSRENIRLWRANTANIFDAIAHNASGSALAGYYNITNQTIVFTGNAVQVKVCTYSPDYTTPALVVDDQFDSALVAGAIPRLNKTGVAQALVLTYGQLYSSMLGAIRQGLTDMPSLPVAQATE